MDTEPAEHMIAHVDVEEFSQNVFTSSKAFYSAHKEGFIVVGAVLATLWISKRGLRSELKRLNFNIEVTPNWGELEY